MNEAIFYILQLSFVMIIAYGVVYTIRLIRNKIFKDHN
jgi:hypothetical protein